MHAEEKTIKHLILVRFFSFYDPAYPQDIFDADFLAENLTLARNNGLRSLANRTNKNFEILFILNARFAEDKKYEFIAATLKDICAELSLECRFMYMPKDVTDWRLKYKASELPSIIAQEMDNYDYVIQSRFDFDDFLYKDAIADMHSKVADCPGVMGYGYCRGYRYVQGELYPFFHFKGVGYHSILGSIIFKSSVAKNLPFLCIYTFPHDKAKLGIKRFVERNGLTFSEDMFQQNIADNAFVYYRHEFSHFILTKNAGDQTVKIKNQTPLTSDDITREQLEEIFGFRCELNSIK